MHLQIIIQIKLNKTQILIILDLILLGSHKLLMKTMNFVLKFSW